VQKRNASLEGELACHENKEKLGSALERRENEEEKREREREREKSDSREISLS